MRGLPFFVWVWVVLFVGLIVGTVGWIGDMLEIHPWWFEMAGFVLAIPSALYLKLTERRWRVC